MSKRVAWLVLSLVPWASACTEKTPDAPPNSGNLSESPDSYLMPAAEPKFNGLLLADQASFKPPPAPRDLPAVELNLPQSLRPASTAPADTASEPADGEAASQPDDAAGSQPASAPAAALRDQAREALSEVPAHPAGMATDAIEPIRTAALAEATNRIKAALLATPFGEGKTLGDAIGGADALEPVTLNNIRVVAMTWADAERLEVEAEISIGDAIDSLRGSFGDVDFAPLEALGRDKCLSAAGIGKAG